MAVVSICVALVVLAGIDRWLEPGRAVRWGLWLLMVSSISGGALWACRTLLYRRSLVAVARDLERRAAIADALLSTGAAYVQRPPRDAGIWMINRTITLAAEAAAAITAWPRISPLPRRLPVIALMTGLVLGLLAASPVVRPWLVRAACPGSALARPGAWRIAVLTSQSQVPAGSEPDLAVAISGGVPGHVTAVVEWSNGRTERRPLRLSDDRSRWQLTLPPVTSALTWQIEARLQPGGPVLGESDRQYLDLAPGLLPLGVRVRVIPPAYSGLPSTTVSGDCAVIAGSLIEVEATVASGGARLVAATVICEPDDAGVRQEIPAQISEVTVKATWTARTPHRWGLRLIASGGHESLPEQRWHVAVTSDGPPRVRFEAVPATIAADGREAVTVVVEDDVALGEAVMEIHRDHFEGPLLARVPVPGASPRRRSSALLIDAAELGLADGDSLALIAVATDHAGHTTRSEPAMILITADGDGWTALAERLGVIQRASLAATTILTELVEVSERSGLEAGGNELLSARLTACLAELSASTQPWPSVVSPLSDVPVQNAVANVNWWTQSAAKMSLSAEPAALSAHLRLMNDELHALAQVIDGQRLRVARTVAAREADAAALAIHRHATALLADHAWQTKPMPGLSATFSADADDAPLIAGGIELPAVLDRELPGLGREHLRIRWQGLLRVPDSGGELELTADDGVALSIAGRECLPAEAWGDHGPTTWRSGVLPGGWQPIDLRWRQGSAGSLLRVAWVGKTTELTADDLRATASSPWLMTTDATAAKAQAHVLDHQRQRLEALASNALPPLPAPSESPWTVVTLPALVTESKAIAATLSQRAAAAESVPGFTGGGPLATALNLAELAVGPARRPLQATASSNSGDLRPAVARAWRWLALAADAVGEDPASGRQRLERESLRVAALAPASVLDQDIARITAEIARLRTDSRASSPIIPPLTSPRAKLTMTGRVEARRDLAVAAHLLAGEIRGQLPNAAVDAESVEALDQSLRQLPPGDKPAAVLAADVQAAQAARAMTERLRGGAARALADTVRADAAPADGARRLARAMAQLNAAAGRLAMITGRELASPVPAAVPVAAVNEFLPPAVTSAGFARARLSAPTLDDRGIGGFRPDQQAAIRAYLARARQRLKTAP